MPGKDKLNELLDKQPIKRGKGYTLSTEPQETAPVQKSTSAEVPQPKVDVRPSKGYKIRTDVAHACKKYAVEQKRPLYEVMEEALIEYLRTHGVDIR